MATNAPWVTRPLGVLPTRWQDHIRVVAYAVRDLPRVQKEDQLTDLHGQVVVLLLITKRPSHTTTARRDDVDGRVGDDGQRLNGGSLADDRLLMAVAMEHK